MKKLTQIISSILLILFSSMFVNAQSVSTDDNNEQNSISELSWVRIESPAKDWSFAIPEGFLVDNEGEGYRIIYSNEKTSINIFMDSKSQGKERLKLQFSNVPPVELKKYAFFEKDTFLGAYRKDEDEKLDKGNYLINLASDSGLSWIQITTKNLNNTFFQYFVQSIQTNGKPLFISANINRKVSKTLQMTSLKTDKIILDALDAEDSKQKELIRDVSIAKDDNLNLDKDDNKIFDFDSQTFEKPLIILRKPRPAFSETGRMRNISGTVKLSVKFLASGKIGEIKLVSSLEKSLDNNAFKAAKKIKFLPPEINGKPVDVIKVLQYRFKVY